MSNKNINVDYLAGVINNNSNNKLLNENVINEKKINDTIDEIINLKNGNIKKKKINDDIVILKCLEKLKISLNLNYEKLDFKISDYFNISQQQSKLIINKIKSKLDNEFTIDIVNDDILTIYL